jgi:hypothetical protein
MSCFPVELTTSSWKQGGTSLSSKHAFIELIFNSPFPLKVRYNIFSRASYMGSLWGATTTVEKVTWLVTPLFAIVPFYFWYTAWCTWKGKKEENEKSPKKLWKVPDEFPHAPFAVCTFVAGVHMRTQVG